jgi:predicted RNA-binding protein
MCQAAVYLLRDGQEEEIMREVISLVPVEEGVRLETFFDEPRIVHGCIARIDFLKHTVMLVPETRRGESHANLRIPMSQLCCDL